MSKKDSVVSEETNTVAPKSAEIPSSEEVIQTLRVQLEEHLKQSEYHKTMAVKAQGALEVLLQMNPEEKQEKNEN
jgi:hypothetical protein